MSEEPETAAWQDMPVGSGPEAPSEAAPPPPPPPPPLSPSASAGPAAAVQDRPEIAVGAAFAGGFVLAMILKRLAS